MAKVTFLGAGSTVFAKNLMGDILSYPELAEDAHLVLHDIDPERLRTSEVVAHKIAEALGVSPVIEATLDRREALVDADYAISMIQVGGYKPGTVVDFEIPKKYGLRQTIADTLGIGGIMRALRTIPVLLDMCHDMEELCPDVTFLQYVNPMAMNCWAISRASTIKTVGLCHSVQGTAHQLARDIGVPFEEINYVCAGINHMAFYLRFERRRTGRETSIRAIRQVIEEGRVPDGTACVTRCFEKSRLLRHRVERALRRVYALVHQARPSRSDGRVQVPLDEYIRRCEAPDRGLGHAAATEFEDREFPAFFTAEDGHRREDPRDGSESDMERRHAAELLTVKRSTGVRLADHPQHGNGQAAASSTATSPTTG